MKRPTNELRQELRDSKLSAARAYMSCVFYDPKILDQHVPSLDAIEDVRLRRILESALAIHARNESVDTVTVRAELVKRHGKVDDELLLNITNVEPRVSTVDRYVEIITDDHRTRLVREVVGKHDTALRSGDPAAPIALASDLETILARELDEGPLAGGTWLSTLGEDIIGETPAARRWLLRLDIGNERSIGWLARGKAGMLASAGGAGKTYLAIQLALAVATGKHWLNSLRIPQPGCVALILAEEDRDEVLSRMHYAAIAMGLNADERKLAASRIWVQARAGQPSALLESDSDGNLRESDFLRALRRYMRGSGKEWALVILDPIARLSPPESEKDNQIATRVVSAIESLAKAPGEPAVLALHHTSKAMRDGRSLDATSARGVTAFNDGFRWSSALGPARNRKRKSVGGFWELRVVKSNYSAAGGALFLTRDIHSNGVMRPATHEEIDENDLDGGEG